MSKALTLGILFAALGVAACGDHPALGDRKAALEYLKTNWNGPPEKSTVHSISYFAVWCAEDEKNYWPEAVKFCEAHKGGASQDLCSYVNLVESARVSGKKSCDPS